MCYTVLTKQERSELHDEQHGKNNAYNDKLIVRKIIKQSWEMVLKPGTDDEVERASCLGDALYNAAREEMYRELPTERLAAFMDSAVWSGTERKSTG